MNKHYSDQISQDQNEQIGKVFSGVTKQIGDIIAKPEIDMTREEKTKAIEMLLEPAIAEVEALQIDPIVKDGLLRRIEQTMIKSIATMHREEVAGVPSEEKKDNEGGTLKKRIMPFIRAIRGY